MASLSVRKLDVDTLSRSRIYAATHNVLDFEHSGIDVLNPFEAAG